jgi:uncharacterized protein involved in propanediol utilization
MTAARAAAVRPPPQGQRRVGRGRARGTFGELLQGILAPDLDFLVTFPVDLYAEATFAPDAELDRLLVSPPHKVKSQRLAARLLEEHGLPPGGRLSLSSVLPEGKGMASSTADLVATARAIDVCHRLRLRTVMLERLMAEIEPSDGIMHPGISVFLHREVRLYRRLGALPPLTVVGIDEGGTVDTVEFNLHREAIPRDWAGRYAALLDRLGAAVREHDLVTVGEVATASARLYQALNPKAHLDAVAETCEEVAGLGVVVGHSGTCVGLILDRSEPGHAEKAVAAIGRLSRLARPLILCHSTTRP